MSVSDQPLLLGRRILSAGILKFPQGSTSRERDGPTIRRINLGIWYEFRLMLIMVFRFLRNFKLFGFELDFAFLTHNNKGASRWQKVILFRNPF
jgi:hypothetical protein